MQTWSQAIHPTAEVHPTALVSPQARIDAGARVGPHCVIGPGARIGPDCALGPRVLVAAEVVVERGCTVDTGAVLGAAGEDPMAAVPRAAAAPVWLEEGCHIGEYTVVEPCPERTTVVGRRAFVMARCHIGPAARVGEGAVLTNQSVLGPGARLEDGCVLGGFCVVAPGVVVGRRAMVGGLSWVVDDVPPFTLVFGVPARPFDINRVGLRRAGCPPQAREALHRVLRMLLLQELEPASVWEQLAPEAEQFEEVRELVEFVRQRPQLVAAWRRQLRPGRGGRGDHDGLAGTGATGGSL